jgi:hypothetical protein
MGWMREGPPATELLQQWKQDWRYHLGSLATGCATTGVGLAVTTPSTAGELASGAAGAALAAVGMYRVDSLKRSLVRIASWEPKIPKIGRAVNDAPPVQGSTERSGEPLLPVQSTASRVDRQWSGSVPAEEEWDPVVYDDSGTWQRGLGPVPEEFPTDTPAEKPRRQSGLGAPMWNPDIVEEGRWPTREPKNDR